MEASKNEYYFVEQNEKEQQIAELSQKHWDEYLLFGDLKMPYNTDAKYTQNT